jgi:hypothetical protein
VVTVCVVAVLVVVEGVVVDDADGFQIVNLHVLLSLKKKEINRYYIFSLLNISYSQNYQLQVHNID